MAKRRSGSRTAKKLIRSAQREMWRRAESGELNGPVTTRQATPEELAAMRARMKAFRLT